MTAAKSTAMAALLLVAMTPAALGNWQYSRAIQHEGATESSLAKRATTLKTVDLITSTSDLDVVEKLIGTARVVAFGEGWHHTHEFLSLRNRLFAYLVEHHGVTAYAGETGFARGILADNFIMGNETLSGDVAGSVFYNEDLHENRQLLEWMRAYNQRKTTTRPVRFYGIDVSSGRSRPDRPAIALDYVSGLDRQVADWFSKRLHLLDAPMSDERYAALPESERNALTVAVSDLISLFQAMRTQWISATSPSTYHLAYRSALVALQVDSHLRSNRMAISTQISLPLVPGQQRDAAMAENVQWVLGQEGPQGRVFLFAHNGHIDKSGYQNGIPSMGSYLQQTLGPQYTALGSLAGRWRGQPLIDDEASPFLRGLNLMRQVDMPLFVLDLSGMASATGDIGMSYDAMFFIPSASPCIGCDAQFPYLGGELPDMSN